MASVNRVILIGNLGMDPELKKAGGQSVCTLSIATSEKWETREGEKVEKTEWHRVVVWRKVAEACAKYLSKGKAVFVEGRLQTRKWEDSKTKTTRYVTEIVGDSVQFLSPADNGKREERQSDKPDGQRFEDDIPF